MVSLNFPPFPLFVSSINLPPFIKTTTNCVSKFALIIHLFVFFHAFALIYYLFGIAFYAPGKMNSDTALFHEVCQLFEELNHITGPASAKRANKSRDTESSLFLSKENKKQVYRSINTWFSKFNSGSLISLFRLLVPEVIGTCAYFTLIKQTLL